MRTFFYNTFLKKSWKGQLIIELLVAFGIAAIFLPALFTSLVASREGKAQQQQRLDAVAALKEVQDAVRTVREIGWETIATNGTYHPVISGNTWTLASGSATVNGFTRQVVISDISRDSSGAITSTGGTVDPSTKRVDATISWTQPYNSNLTSTMYLTRFLDNASYTETTQTQFNAGIKSGVVVRATSPAGVPDDGEVSLGAGGNSDWCDPQLIASAGASLDLPGQGYPSTITAIEGQAFMGTGENSSGLSFMSADISNSQPPVATLGDTFDGHKTNGVFGEEDYGYIVTDTNSKEVVIIDISGQTYTESGYFNAPGNGSGRAVYIVGNYGYMTTGNKLYSFDVSSKTGSRPLIDTNGVTLAGTGVDVFIIGNYAYVAVAGSAIELQIVDVSNPNNLVVVGQADVNGQAAKSIFVDSSGNRTYLATGQSATQREMFIIDTTVKTGNRALISSYEANGMDPRGITVVPGNRAILVGHNGEEYQVINIANETSPVHCGGSQLDSGINDVASVLESDGDAYSYIMTGEADNEFRVIAGGPGGTFATDGIFESQTFSSGYATANNSFSATFNEPSGTDILFQVSLTGLVGGSCPASGSYTFVGPDGTTGTYFDQASEEAITFPFTTTGTYTNPGQCFRYKAYFSTTNVSSTPVLYDIVINYSP